MQSGEIYLAKFPWGGTVGMKIRPVLLLADPVGAVPELVTAYISSVIPNSLLPSDIVLDPASQEHAGSRLKTVSVLRLHKIATIHARDALRLLGLLSPVTMTEVKNRLRQLLRI